MSGDESHTGGEPRPVEIGDLVDKRYKVVRVRERADYGGVFDAAHLHLDQEFTLKIVDPQFDAESVPVERLKHEGRATSLVQHENAIFVTDIGRCPRHGHFLVTEKRHGSRLSSVLRSEGQLDVAAAACVLLEAANAVADAHALGIIHSGIHPDNLLVDLSAKSGWMCKVMGFGVSGPVLEEWPAGGAAFAEYRAPELGFGAEPDAKSDQFAIAAVAFRMLTGRCVSREEIDNDDVVPPGKLNSDVPPDLGALVLTGLRRSPDQRYDSVDEMLDDLVMPDESFSEPRSDPWDNSTPSGTSEPQTVSGMKLYTSSADPVSLVINLGSPDAGGPGKRKSISMAFQTHERLRREYRRNVVAGGLFVPTDEQMNLHDEVDLEVRLSGGGEPIEVRAEVVSIQEGGADVVAGVGLSLERNSIDAFGRFVRREAGLALEPDDMLVVADRDIDPESLSRAASYLVYRLSSPTAVSVLRRETEGLPFDLTSEVTKLVERGLVEVQPEEAESADNFSGSLETEMPTSAKLDGQWGAGALIDFESTFVSEDPDAGHLGDANSLMYTEDEVVHIRSMVDYYVRRQNYLAAIRTLRKALVVSPDVTEFHHRLAQLHMQFTGDLERAHKALDQALALEPENESLKRTRQRLESSA